MNGVKRWVLRRTKNGLRQVRKTDNGIKKTSFKHEVVKELGAS